MYSRQLCVGASDAAARFWLGRVFVQLSTSDLDAAVNEVCLLT